jgi:anthranilate phosphoribosyltransferase
MKSCMTEIMEGQATDAQIGAFLAALRVKGETVDEITGATTIMRDKAAKIKAPEGTLDTCGTGGDMAGTINISTTAALIVAAAGVPVAKHGNRSVSSQSGSADVLEALGIKIDLSPEHVEKCLFETGFGFLFAPLFHPAMKYAIGPRKEMGIRTIFNILGPITNPAGLDEITITDGTKVSRFSKGKLENSIISPEDFGLKRAKLSDIAGGDKESNARTTLSILEGEKGPKRDIVLMNSAAALVVAGKTENLREAFEMAAEAVDSGKSKDKLEEVKKFTQSI